MEEYCEWGEKKSLQESFAGNQKTNISRKFSLLQSNEEKSFFRPKLLTYLTNMGIFFFFEHHLRQQQH